MLANQTDSQHISPINAGIVFSILSEELCCPPEILKLTSVLYFHLHTNTEKKAYTIAHETDSTNPFILISCFVVILKRIRVVSFSTARRVDRRANNNLFIPLFFFLLKEQIGGGGGRNHSCNTTNGNQLFIPLFHHGTPSHKHLLPQGIAERPSPLPPQGSPCRFP